MKMNFVAFPALVLAAAVSAQAQGQTAPAPKPPAPATASTAPAGTATPAVNAAFPTRIGLINMRDALMKTNDGQKGVLDLEDKFASRKTTLQKRNIDLQAKQDQLNRGGSTMSDAAKQALAKELEADSKNFKRDVEDLNTDAQDSETKLMQEIWAKMQPVLAQFALQNNLAAVLDVGTEQSPVLWASNTVFIQDQVVILYNQSHPATVPAKTAAPAAKPPAPVPPPTKKQ